MKHEVIGSRLSVWVKKEPGIGTIGEGGRLLFTVPQGTDLGAETVSGAISVRFASPMEGHRFELSSVSGSLAVGSIMAQS